MRELIWLASPPTLLVTEEEIDVARDKNDETLAVAGGGGGGACFVGDVGAEVVFFFEPKVKVRGGSEGSRLAAGRAALAPGVAEVGRAPPSWPSLSRSESSFSPARSPCEKRRFKKDVVEVNLEEKLAKPEMLTAV